MLDPNLLKIMNAFVEHFGQDSLHELLKSKIEADNSALTIVANHSTHNIPDDIIYGEKYTFSEGSMPLTNEGISEYLTQALMALATKLKSKRWTKIYLIPAGHPLLSMQIKLLVFRITRLETVDIAYFGAAGYFEVDLPQRQIIEQAT